MTHCRIKPKPRVLSGSCLRGSSLYCARMEVNKSSRVLLWNGKRTGWKCFLRWSLRIDFIAGIVRERGQNGRVFDFDGSIRGGFDVRLNGRI
jgi:hypothetical protein